VPPAPAPNHDIGPYTLANRIAVGGMAEVFRALEPRAAGEDRAVVIKRMLPALAAEAACGARFDDEARQDVRIRPGNVVDVIDHGVDADLPYIVLEYVFGVDLWRLVRWLTHNGRRLRTEVAVYLATELLAGLEAVHAVCDETGEQMRVVHRDVSPSNVFLSVHGDVKLGDLGIAQARWRERHPLAPAGERAKGKLGYLAPEQAAGRPGDQRADVFSAAVIVAELLLGRPLFAGGSEIAVLLAIRDANVRPFAQHARGLPEGLGDAVLGALARSPEDRMATARALRGELLPFATGAPGELRRELGDLVAKALAEGEPSRGALDRAALAQTVEEDVNEVLDERTPEVPSAPSGRAPSLSPEDGARLFDVDSPGGPAASEYAVETADGRELGPWRYARAVQAVATGEIAIGDRIRRWTIWPGTSLPRPRRPRSAGARWRRPARSTISPPAASSGRSRRPPWGARPACCSATGTRCARRSTWSPACRPSSPATCRTSCSASTWWRAASSHGRSSTWPWRSCRVSRGDSATR